MSGGFVPSDQAVRDAIRTDLDSNLCVEAGAGTGKTTVLVDRTVEVLRAGRASIDEIAVITFTEKAAAELTARVRDDLERALARRPESGGGERRSDQRERLREALLGLHRARIETIHAFAANVLRERPVEARLDPGFEVLDRLAADLDFDRAYRAWLERLFGARGSGSRELRRALNRGFDLPQLREAAEALHHRREVLPLDPPAPLEVPDPGPFVAQLESACGELEEIAAGCVREDDAGYLQIAGILRFGAEVAAAAGDRERLERVLLQRAPPIKQKGRMDAFADPDQGRRLKHVLRELKAALEPIREALRSEALVGVLPLVERFVLDYEHKRRAEGRADFHDLLIWARNLLRDNLEVRDHFRGRFRCVLVDEFQDTDPIQAELIMYVCSDAGDGGHTGGGRASDAGDGAGGAGNGAGDAGDWRELRLRPGALFVVGDPKQAIYRFRGADMAVYDELKGGALAGGVRELVQNFRSPAGMIGWLNGVFDRVLVPDEGVQPANIHLAALPGAGGAQRSPIVALHGEGEVRSAGQVRSAEAGLLAAVIRRAVERERWPVRDPGTGERRTARWRDVAVIVPWRTEIQLYEDAFAEAGVPYRHEGNRSFFQRQEVRELAACLYAVDDPTDQANLVAALRSGAFACSDEELLMFVSDGGRLDYRARPPAGHEAVAEALAVLAELHSERRRLALPELAHRLLERTRLVELALTLPQGDQAAGNLLKVVDQARAFSGAGGGGLRAFARWLSSTRDPESEEAEASVVEETDDVVRLLTIHRAKGLEFPIVALANLNARHPRRKAALPERAGGRLHLAIGSPGGVFATPGFDDAWEQEKLHIEAEQRRMLYVATTRARDHLVLPVVPRAGGKVEGLLKELRPDLPDWDESRAGSDVGACHLYERELLAGVAAGANGGARVPARAAVAAALAEREKWLAERDAVLAGAARGAQIVTASSLERWERPVAQRAEEVEGVPLSGDRASAVGDALHRTMQVVDLPRGGNLEAVARAMCAEAGVGDRAGEVIGMARTCLESDVVKRALASDSCYREVGFTVELDDGSLATGRMDLLFREAGELVIVDYKSDRVSEAGLARRIDTYRGQAATYALGAERATGLPVREVVLLFARAGVERAVAVEDTGARRGVGQSR